MENQILRNLSQCQFFPTKNIEGTAMGLTQASVVRRWWIIAWGMPRSEILLNFITSHTYLLAVSSMSHLLMEGEFMELTWKGRENVRAVMVLTFTTSTLLPPTSYRIWKQWCTLLATVYHFGTGQCLISRQIFNCSGYLCHYISIITISSSEQTRCVLHAD